MASVALVLATAIVYEVARQLVLPEIAWSLAGDIPDFTPNQLLTRVALIDLPLGFALSLAAFSFWCRVRLRWQLRIIATLALGLPIETFVSRWYDGEYESFGLPLWYEIGILIDPPIAAAISIALLLRSRRPARDAADPE